MCLGTTWTASLPMYDLPELGIATDMLWQAIGKNFEKFGLQNVPRRLSCPADIKAHWQRPNLLFSQTCGYPLMKGLHNEVQLVATPIYTAEGCEGAWHRSAIIVRQNSTFEKLADLHRGICAINGRDSNSGMNLFRAALPPLAQGGPFFSDVLVTKAHVNSLAAVVKGRADVAAVGCVTFALLSRIRPVAIASLRRLAWTPSSPSLPFITTGSLSLNIVAKMREALEKIIRDPALQSARRSLLLDRFEVLPLSDYAQILRLERSAVDLGYTKLV